MPKIEELYAFVSYNKDDPTDEGLMAMRLGDQWIPLIGADMKRVEHLKKHAEITSTFSNKPYKILHFKLIGEIK